MSTYRGIKPDDRVAYLSSRNVVMWGRAVALGTKVTHVHVSCGRNGVIRVDDSNYYAHIGPGSFHRGWPAEGWTKPSTQENAA